MPIKCLEIKHYLVEGLLAMHANKLYVVHLRMDENACHAKLYDLEFAHMVGNCMPRNYM